MNYNPFSLENKTILVTGASSGIGKATAVECSKMGARVIITGRNEERLRETFEALEPGKDHLSFSTELTDADARDSMAASIPVIDGLVLTPGIAPLTPFTHINEKNTALIMDTNFTSLVLLTKSIIVKKKMNKKGGSIVFLSSVSGPRISYIGGSLYSASKAAISGMVKGMSLEMAKRNIRVNALCPGDIDTPILRQHGVTEEEVQARNNVYPLGRMGKTEEVAWAAIYFLSDASAWVTGTDFFIDGGLTF